MLLFIGFISVVVTACAVLDDTRHTEITWSVYNE